MHFSTLYLTTGLLAVAGVAMAQTATTSSIQPAPTTQDNPEGVTYEALFDVPGKIQGSITFTAGSDGTGVVVDVKDLDNFPSTGGPFLYHVHTHSVPSDGNCTGTLGHLDPYGVTEKTKCDLNAPKNCQVGDLSGKHGTITPDKNDRFSAIYTDDFLSTNASDVSYIGGLSVTIHLNNTTRIACANITQVEGTAVSGSNNTIPSNIPPPAISGASSILPMLGYLAFGFVASILL